MSDVSEVVIHEVAEHALPDFLARVAKLSKKSVKLLGKPIAPVFHGDIIRNIQVNGRTHDRDGHPFVRTFHRVSVSGETPKINGYTFMATIDHNHAVGNLIRAVPGAGPIPVEYRTAEASCDHCKTPRRRNDTFILRCDADDTFQQIGSKCLRDFIGYDVTSFIESAKWLSGLEPSDKDGEGGYGGFGDKTRDIKLTTFLAHASAVIRVCGWVSKKMADDTITSTASQTIENMFPHPKYRHLATPVVARDHEIAEQAITYARSLSGDRRSNYENGLYVLGHDEFITYASIGYAASMIPALFRHQEVVLKRAETVNKPVSTDGAHLGEIGERLIGVAATITNHRALPPDIYGVKHIYTFVTSANNVLVWFASAAQVCNIGDHVVLDGTVKKHDNFRGTNQTGLTRCKLKVVQA